MPMDVMPVDACHTWSMMKMSGTGVRLEFHHMVKFPTDSGLECNGMITINVSEMIPHLSTNFTKRHLTSGFGMGWAARACLMILRRSIVILSRREVLGKVISVERRSRGSCGLVRRAPQSALSRERTGNQPEGFRAVWAFSIPYPE